MDGGVYFPSETGIAQGGVLSPLLMNIALHGMEEAVTGGKASRASSQSREQPLLVRYGDDFVILHADLHELQQAERRVQRWLAAMGLQLNAQKTRIAHTLIPGKGEAGFDFLGFNIRQEQAEKHPEGKRKEEHASWLKTMVNPSKEARQLTDLIGGLATLPLQQSPGMKPLATGDHGIAGTTLETILGMEGAGSAAYFRCFGKLLSDPRQWPFPGRVKRPLLIQ